MKNKYDPNMSLREWLKIQRSIKKDSLQELSLRANSRIKKMKKYYLWEVAQMYHLFSINQKVRVSSIDHKLLHADGVINAVIQEKNKTKYNVLISGTIFCIEENHIKPYVENLNIRFKNNQIVGITGGSKFLNPKHFAKVVKTKRGSGIDIVHVIFTDGHTLAAPSINFRPATLYLPGSDEEITKEFDAAKRMKDISRRVNDPRRWRKNG